MIKIGIDLTTYHQYESITPPQVKEKQIHSLTLVNRPKLLRCWIKTDVLSSQRYLSWPHAKAARCQGKFFQLDGTHVWYFCWLFLSLSFIFSMVHPMRIAFNTSWVININNHYKTHTHIYLISIPRTPNGPTYFGRLFPHKMVQGQPAPPPKKKKKNEVYKQHHLHQVWKHPQGFSYDDAPSAEPRDCCCKLIAKIKIFQVDLNFLAIEGDFRDLPNNGDPLYGKRDPYYTMVQEIQNLLVGGVVDPFGSNMLSNQIGSFHHKQVKSRQSVKHLKHI